MAGRLRRAALDWYDAHGRTLYLRTLTDPYAIWVAETMSQQTQMTRIEEAHRRFLARFPSVTSLADATTAEVLRAWAGLGYNRRAVNLRRAARMIVQDHAGRLPTSVEGLSRLPGIGPYTARAIAATAFGARVTALDTNAARVLSRCLSPSRAAAPADRFGVDRPSSTADRALQARADALASASRAADWNHALMDIGATICRPRPRCEVCPLRPWCASGRRPHDRPTKAGRSGRPGSAALPFVATRRWLRGRIVDDLRRARPGEWTAVTAPIGVHGPVAVDSALAALQRDGIIELRTGGLARLAG